MKKILIYILSALFFIHFLGYLFTFGTIAQTILPLNHNNNLADPKNWSVASISPELKEVMRLQEGDKLLAINNKEYESFFVLEEELLGLKGETIDLLVLRQKEKKTIQAKIPEDLKPYRFDERLEFEPQVREKGAVSLPQAGLNRVGVSMVIVGLGAVINLLLAVFLLIKKEKKIVWYGGAMLIFLFLLLSLNPSRPYFPFEILYYLVMGMIMIAAYALQFHNGGKRSNGT